MDEWMGTRMVGRRNGSLDGSRHPGGGPARRRYQQAIQKVIQTYADPITYREDRE